MFLFPILAILAAFTANYFCKVPPEKPSRPSIAVGLVIALAGGAFGVLSIFMFDLVRGVLAEGLRALTWVFGDAKGNMMETVFAVFTISSALNMLGVTWVFIGHDLRYGKSCNAVEPTPAGDTGDQSS